MQNQLAVAGQGGVAPSEFPPVPVLWHTKAVAKGFELLRRVRDRYHVELGCRHCGAAFICKAFVLRTAQPQCPACLLAGWKNDAERAGVQFLHRDPDDRHRAVYRLGCGHEVNRQMGQVRRVADDETGLACEFCTRDRQEATARERGWALIGGDHRGTNYRRYRHACGHEQSIAVGNMVTGRVGCASCGCGWTAGESFLYVLDLVDPVGRSLIKLGYSKDPWSRMRHQLGLRLGQCSLMRSVRIATGHDAIRIEKTMHAKLRRRFPSAVVPAAELHGWIHVTSEIYHPAIAADVNEMLNQVEASAHA